MSFRIPVDNATKSQGFGENPAYYKQFGQVGHNGVDWAVPIGTPVHAMDEGTVSFEGWGQNHSWMGTPAGICVLINHVGSYGGYAHLSKTIVSKGDHVSKGQIIGYSGQTGAATGPHEHSEMLPLSPNFKNGYAGRINITPYYDSTNTQPQGDTNVATIQNSDNWRARANKSFISIRGRSMGAGEFEPWIGKDFLHLIEALEDDAEADMNVQAANLGRQATAENWQGQITDLKAKPSADTAELNSLKAAFKVVGQFIKQVGGF